ncbi:putative CoA-transferase [compost metagenome]
MARHAGLVYARISGWGQTGARARQPGHDINYLAATGVLGLIGERGGPPVPPLNLLADYAGGSLFAAYGICAALLDGPRRGRGCVVDAAMADGVLALMTPLFSLLARGLWSGARGENMLDGGAPWYGVYRTADGRHLAVGAIEQPFRRAFFEGLGLSAEYVSACESPAGWPATRDEIARIIVTQDLAHWQQVYQFQDACVTPVATLEEVLRDAAFLQRNVLIEDPLLPGLVRPAPAPFVVAGPGLE